LRFDDLEIIALGEMGWNWADLGETPPAQLVLAIEGFNRIRRENAELMRIHAFISVSPYMDAKKGISIQKLWPMPWDKEKSKKDKKELEAQAQRARQIWDLIDQNKELKQTNK
jgi:hypothetical protein